MHFLNKKCSYWFTSSIQLCSYHFTSLHLFGFVFIMVVEKRSAAFQSLHFPSSTEQCQGHFCSMRPYSFLSPSEAVLRCTGMNCCNANWDVFPVHPGIFTHIQPSFDRKKYTNSSSPRLAQHCNNAEHCLDTTWRTAETENILRNPYIWYTGDVQAN